MKTATDILRDRNKGDKSFEDRVEKERLNAHVAQLVYDARTKAGLTQAELAELLNTEQPSIARLEDADYDGHSLSMLARIASALHQRLEVNFVPELELQA